VKNRWLRPILLLSVMWVLLLLPAGALSQGEGESLGWGTARIDGVLQAREWEPATRLTLTGREVFWIHGEGDKPPKPAGDDVETGVLLLMNDATHLFVGMQASFDDFTANPEDWNCFSEVCFSDEWDPWDGVWAAKWITDTTTHEGCYMAGWGNEPEYPELYFSPGTEEDCWGPWPGWPMGPGVEVASAPAQTFSWEWAIDLDDSYLDKFELGECFPLAVAGEGWSWLPEWQENGNWFGHGARGEFQWPPTWYNSEDCPPDTFASVCLHPNPYHPCEPPSAINHYIQGLPESAFRQPAPQRMKALENKLLHDPDSVANLIRADNIQDAIDKLKDDMRAKLDGSLGGNPNDDWITQPSAQDELALKIDCLVAYLEALL
jgi:hypothetical protein